MRKKERKWVTIGLVLLFVAIAWWAYNGHASPGVLLDLGDNSTEEQTSTPTVAVQNIATTVGSDASVKISFSVVASEGATVQNVSLYYARNVADPNNATYTKLSATENNGTYEATVSAQFGDVVYYYIEVIYLANNETKAYKTEIYTLTVTDTYAPTLNSVSIDYNSTVLAFAINFDATDNDRIAKYYVYYLDLGNSTSLSANATFTPVEATTLPVIVANITEGNYYAFYFKVEDLSGNLATLYNETAPLIIQANSSTIWPQIYPPMK